MSSELPEIGAFAHDVQQFLQAMKRAAKAPESELVERMQAHLGADPNDLPVTSADLSCAEHANLQLAADELLPEPVGYVAPFMAFQGIGLTEILNPEGVSGEVKPGPVQRDDVEVGDGRVVACVSRGIYFTERDGAPVVLVIARNTQPFGGSSLRLEGVSTADGAVRALIDDLRDGMRRHNVFRGQTISLSRAADDSVSVQFHRLAAVERDGVILPPGTLERLERHTLGIASVAERLTRAGRHLKRGVLLHGPPGTGKTLSINYIVGAMPGRTTILLTGRGLELIGLAMQIARELAPATVVFEDVDLIATERTLEDSPDGPLFELLNEMEGLADDADLLFLLTSNRPDVLEPALAARPGRIDLALEVPLPDAMARERLLELYAGGIELDGPALADAVTRTEGVSGAFVKELMRQAELRAALADSSPTAADVTATLDDLLADRSALTRRLLGHGDRPEMVRAVEAAGLSGSSDGQTVT